MSIEEVIDKVKKIERKYGGSSVRDGVLYHDLPFAGLEKLKSHRKSTRDRIELINFYIDAKYKIILDIGCSVGGISLGMAEKGAEHILAVDYDKESIEVAKETAKFLGYQNVDFVNTNINLEWVKTIPKFDVILWLSQWQWIVKQYGLEYAKQLLFEVSKRGQMMIFESAADDGMAKMRGITQDDIYHWLCENTIYEKINRYKSVDSWMKGRRELFVCFDPWLRISVRRKASTSIVERIAVDKVKKMYRGEKFYWMIKREAEALERLKNFQHYPKLLETGKDYIIMSYVGRNDMKKIKWMKEQAKEIIDELKSVSIEYRDVKEENFLILRDKLYLIDFGWCLFDDEKESSLPMLFHGRHQKEILDLFKK